MKNLKNKTVFITGASAGIGEACARAFAQEGSNLILVARREERLHKLCSELQNEFEVKTRALVLDIRNSNDVINKLADVGQVDILINNAGLARGVKKSYEMEYGHYDDVFDTNVKGLMYVTRALVPAMVERGSGDIINIGSIAGHEVYPGGAVYCASKHAVDALTKGLRLDLVDTPLRVSSIDPGLVETEFSMVRFEGDKEKAQNVYKGLKPLYGEDIAEVAVFIASRPAHVQVADVIVFPTAQAAASTVHRR